MKARLALIAAAAGLCGLVALVSAKFSGMPAQPTGRLEPDPVLDAALQHQFLAAKPRLTCTLDAPCYAPSTQGDRQ